MSTDTDTVEPGTPSQEDLLAAFRTLASAQQPGPSRARLLATFQTGVAAQTFGLRDDQLDGILRDALQRIARRAHNFRGANILAAYEAAEQEVTGL